MSKWTSRLQGVIEAYGPVALGVWFGLFFLTLTGFAVALSFGVQLGTGASGASTGATTVGVWGAAYIATQLTKPFRAIGTLALTPVIAGWLGRQPIEPDPERDPESQ